MGKVDLANINNLSPTEVTILNEILQRIESGKKTKIREVASLAFVSTTSVVKLAKKLGYTGYSDMMFSLSKGMLELKEDDNTFKFASHFPAVKQGSAQKFCQFLHDCQNNRICVLGLGFSTIATSYIDKKLTKANFQVYEGSPLDMIRGNNKESMIIFVSNSAETNDLYQIMQQCCTFRYKIVLFTANPNGKMAQLADICFVLNDDLTTPFSNAPDYFIGKVIILFEYLLSNFLVTTNK